VDERRVAPFTPEEVASLNEFQTLAVWNPVVCPAEGCCQKPVATGTGWACPRCAFTQVWADRWMTDGIWRNEGQILKREG
jgi:hypothetical protein